MTVHRIQIMSATDVNAQKVRDKIRNLKSDYGGKLSKENIEFKQRETISGDQTFYEGIFIVTLDSDNKDSEKNDLTEQIRKEIDKSASWWQLRWHECSHDKNNPDPCSWEYQNDSGDIPSEVAW